MEIDTECFRCPYCVDCKECKEFRKIMSLKDANLVIYRHTPSEEFQSVGDFTNVNRQRNYYKLSGKIPDTKDPNSAFNNVILMLNTGNVDLTSEDFLPEFDKNSISCPRCQYIMEHTKLLLGSVSVVNKSDVIGVCNQCWLKHEGCNGICKVCNKIVNRFKSSKRSKDDRERKNAVKKLSETFTTKDFKSTQSQQVEQKGKILYPDIDISKVLEADQSTQHSPEVKPLFSQLEKPKYDPYSLARISDIHQTKKMTKIEREYITSGDKPQKSVIFGSEVSNKRIIIPLLGRFKPTTGVPQQAIERSLISPYNYGDGVAKLKREDLSAMQRNHSEESLLISLSEINEELFTKEFKYFFPKKGNLRKEDRVVKSSFELFKETQDRLKLEGEEKERQQEEEQKKRIAAKEIIIRKELARQRDEISGEKAKLSSDQDKIEGKKKLESTHGSLMNLLKDENFENTMKTNKATKKKSDYEREHDRDNDGHGKRDIKTIKSDKGDKHENAEIITRNRELQKNAEQKIGTEKNYVKERLAYSEKLEREEGKELEKNRREQLGSSAKATVEKLSEIIVDSKKVPKDKVGKNDLLRYKELTDNEGKRLRKEENVRAKEETTGKEKASSDSKSKDRQKKGELTKLRHSKELETKQEKTAVDRNSKKERITVMYNDKVIKDKPKHPDKKYTKGTAIHEKEQKEHIMTTKDDKPVKDKQNHPEDKIIKAELKKHGDKTAETSQQDSKNQKIDLKDLSGKKQENEVLGLKADKKIKLVMETHLKQDKLSDHKDTNKKKVSPEPERKIKNILDSEKSGTEVNKEKLPKLTKEASGEERKTVEQSSFKATKNELPQQSKLKEGKRQNIDESFTPKADKKDLPLPPSKFREASEIEQKNNEHSSSKTNKKDLPLPQSKLKEVSENGQKFDEPTSFRIDKKNLPLTAPSKLNESSVEGQKFDGPLRSKVSKQKIKETEMGQNIDEPSSSKANKKDLTIPPSKLQEAFERKRIDEPSNSSKKDLKQKVSPKAPNKDELNLLNKALLKQDLQKGEGLKIRQTLDEKLNKSKLAAAQKLKALPDPLASKPTLNIDKKEQPIKQQQQKQKAEIVEQKSQAVDMKNIKLEISQDDMILKMIKTRSTREDKSKPVIQALPQKCVQRKILPKKITPISSAISLISATDQDEESSISEVIFGETIYKKSDVPIKGPEELQPSIFKSAFTTEGTAAKKKYIEPENEEVPQGVIRYALSDRKFIDNGWTILPTEKIVRKMNVYRMRPAHPEFDWFERNKNKGAMQYDTGEKLAECDKSGRGRWYYRSGRIALDFYNSEEINSQKRIVIYSNGEPDERGRSCPVTVLGMFDYKGNGVVFDHNGKIRLKYTQDEGVVLDRAIGPVSHWKWHSLNDPPVLQQVMMDSHMTYLDPEIAQFAKDAGEVPKTKSGADPKILAIEFENYIKSRNKKMTENYTPYQIKMKALKINEQFSLRILDQASIYLLYSDGSTSLKLNLGMKIDQNEIVDTDLAELGQIACAIEMIPAPSASVEQLQRAVANARQHDRMRTERERLVRPQCAVASADRLTATLSRPPLKRALSDSTNNLNHTIKQIKHRKPSYTVYCVNSLV